MPILGMFVAILTSLESTSEAAAKHAASDVPKARQRDDIGLTIPRQLNGLGKATLYPEEPRVPAASVSLPGTAKSERSLCERKNLR